MATTVLNLSSNQCNDSFGIGDTTISQKEDLFWVTLNNLFIENLLQRFIDLCSTHIGSHFLYLSNGQIQIFFTVFYALFEKEVESISEGNDIKVSVFG